MGRNKKYNTDAERLEAKRKWARDYYYRNKFQINKKTMEKYYEQKKSKE